MNAARWQLVADDVCCIDSGSQSEAAALADALRDSGEWQEVLAGRCTVYVQFNLARLSAAEALARLETFEAPPESHAEVAGIVNIPACYDPSIAPDLDDTCERLGMSRDELVHAHTSATHTVAMLGFMPGFAYIDGLPHSLRADRLDEPRQHVAAGSIGIAGGQTGIYPFDGPGGWRIIARTPLTLFRPGAMPPALLRPMQKVRFVAITRRELNELQGKS